MSLPSFYQIDFSTGNGHLLANELRRIATGKATLTETSARIAMLQEFQQIAATMGFTKQAYLITNILSGAIWQLVNSEEIDIKNTTDLQLQQHLLNFFEQSVGRFVASNPDSAPEQAYQWYVAQRQNAIARAQYELDKLELKKAPQKALPDLTQLGANGKHAAIDYEQLMIVCDVCKQKGFPVIRASAHGGVWNDGVYHIDDSSVEGEYHVMRVITDKSEAMSLKQKYPNLKSLLHFRKRQHAQQNTTMPAQPTEVEGDIQCTKAGCNLKGDIRVFRKEGFFWQAIHHYDPLKQKYTYHDEQKISEQKYQELVKLQPQKSKRISRKNAQLQQAPAAAISDNTLKCPNCNSSNHSRHGKRFNIYDNKPIITYLCRDCGRKYSSTTAKLVAST